MYTSILFERPIHFQKLLTQAVGIYEYCPTTREYTVSIFPKCTNTLHIQQPPANRDLQV